MRSLGGGLRVGAAVMTLLIAAPVLAQGPPAEAAAAHLTRDRYAQGWKADRAYRTAWDEYQAMKASARGGAKMTWARLPDWTGLWTHENGFAVDPDQQGRTPTAELTPEYQKRFDEKMARVARGDEWDPLSACLPAGHPRWLVEPFLREFILRPEEAWLVTEQNAEIRRVYTDGRGHVPEDEAYPLWEGDSIGFWDGDTLVIHTNHLKAGSYQRQQPDHSDQVETVERWRRVGPDRIEALVAIYDPVALRKPWRVRHTYGRVTTPNLRINHWSCEENNNVVQTPEGSSNFILPGEKGYKDPDKPGPSPSAPAAQP